MPILSAHKGYSEREQLNPIVGTDAGIAVLQILWPSSLLVVVIAASHGHRNALAYVDLLALQCLSDFTSTSNLTQTQPFFLLTPTVRPLRPVVFECCPLTLNPQ
jgi:hypothetical protein